MLSNLTRFVILLVKIQSPKDACPLRKKERASAWRLYFLWFATSQVGTHGI
ncbi:unnamed protein product [Prunus brigantina]